MWKIFFKISMIFLGINLFVSTGLFFHSKKTTIDNILTKNGKNNELLEEIIHNTTDQIITDGKYLAKQTESYLEFYPNNIDTLLEQTFEQYALSKEYFSQILLIDKFGNEKIKVNYAHGKTELVPNELLKNIKTEYYFKHCISLNPNDIFLSPINQSHDGSDQIDKNKSTIRVCIPIFNNDKKAEGIIVVNYLANLFLERFDYINAITNGYGTHLLINTEGDYIKGLKSEDNLGYIPKNRQFKEDFEAANKYLQSNPNGIFKDENGIFLFRPVQIDKEHIYTLKQTNTEHIQRSVIKRVKTFEPIYYIVSFVSTQEYRDLIYKNYSPWIHFNGITLLPVLVLVWLLARYEFIKHTAEVLLKQKTLKVKTNINLLENLNASVQEKHSEIARQNEKIRQLNESIRKAKQGIKFNIPFKQWQSKPKSSKQLMVDDIKNDLSSLFGFSEIINPQSKKHIIDKTNRISELLIESADNANTIINTIMKWSKKEIDQMVFHPESFNLKILINDILYLSQQEISDKHITAQSSVIKPVFVYADISMIGIMLRKLLQKVIGIANPGSHISISLNKITTQEFVTVNIRFNTNIANSDKINELFACNADHNSSPANVLLCEEFVKKHNSQITIENETNHKIKISFEIKRWFPEHN